MRSVRQGECSGGSACPSGRVLRSFRLRRCKFSRNDPGHGKSNHAQRSLPRRDSQVARGTTRPRPGPFCPQTAPFSFFKGGCLPLGRASDPTLTYPVLPPLRGSQSPTPQRSRLRRGKPLVFKAVLAFQALHRRLPAPKQNFTNLSVISYVVRKPQEKQQSRGLRTADKFIKFRALRVFQRTGTSPGIGGRSASCQSRFSYMGHVVSLGWQPQAVANKRKFFPGGKKKPCRGKPGRALQGFFLLPSGEKQ